jgi:hemerythrin-like domain-containing protein
MIPGPQKDTTYYRKYSTTFKLEGANDNYIDYSTGKTSFIAAFGDKLKDADAETLFNSLADKLKKALGAEMLYTFEQGKESYNKFNKKMSFINKNDDSDNKGIILKKTKTSDPENLFRVEILAVNHWSVAY